MKFLLTISVFCIKVVSAQTTCVNKNSAFKAGEEITYKIYYQWSKAWVNAGEVKFEVSSEKLNNKPIYHITGTGKTYPAYDWFYKVRDKYETFIDTATLLPLRFIRNVSEGKNMFYEFVNFNREKKKAYSPKKTTTITDCTHDALSAIYFCRNINFSEFEHNKVIPINLFLDDKIYDMNIRYIGKENITVALGTFNCIKFKVKMIAGTIFSEDDEMIIWVSNDENKLPIHIETEIIVGTIKVDLIHYKGLVKDLTRISR